MKHHPKKSIWIRRCICGKVLATWNKSGFCSSCHTDIYTKNKKGGMKQNDN